MRAERKALARIDSAKEKALSRIEPEAPWVCVGRLFVPELQSAHCAFMRVVRSQKVCSSLAVVGNCCRSVVADELATRIEASADRLDSETRLTKTQEVEELMKNQFVRESPLPVLKEIYEGLQRDWRGSRCRSEHEAPIKGAVHILTSVGEGEHDW